MGMADGEPGGMRGSARLLVTAAAASRLSAAAAWLDDLPPDAELLVIGPGWEACDDIVRGALGQAGARFGVVRTTLGRLAARLAAAELAASARAPVTDLALLAVVTRAVHRLAREGAFTYFSPVADRPGFPPALVRTLDELAMNGVAPGALRRLPQGGPDLARLAEAVTEELGRDGLADRAAVYAAARTAVAGTPPPRPIGLPVLLLDVPAGSEREEALIAAIARRAPAVLATAADGDARSIARLERALGCSALRQGGADAGSLAALQRHLFETAARPAAPLDDGVSLTAW